MEIVREAWDAYSRRDYDRLAGIHDPHIVVITLEDGAVYGNDAVLANYERWHEAWEAAEGALAEAEDRLHELTAAATAGGPEVRELRDEWPSLTLAERREVLSRSIEAVEVRRAPHPGAKVPAAERVRVVFRR